MSAEQEMTETMKHGRKELGKWSVDYVGYFFKWLLLSIVTGLVCGVTGALFERCVEAGTEIRSEHEWLIFLLPLSGLLIVFLYRKLNLSGVGTR